MPYITIAIFFLLHTATKPSLNGSISDNNDHYYGINGSGQTISSSYVLFCYALA